MIFKTVLLSSRIAMAMARSAPKLQEIKTFMVELGLCQVWASKREQLLTETVNEVYSVAT